MSNLATVQIIKHIENIDGADNIVLAFVLGWQVVVKKNEFRVGDKICYIQIDTVVPDLPEYTFLKERKFRVRTIKLRGQISQGLIVPLPPGICREGDDLTAVLGVKKYEKPDNNPVFDRTPKMPAKWYMRWLHIFRYNYLYRAMPWLRAKSRSDFPKHLVPITDEVRIQNNPGILQSHRGRDFVVTHKLDGSSITIIHTKTPGRSRFRICSRRFELHGTGNDWHRVFRETDFGRHILKLVAHYGTDRIIVQGEAIGKFNGNHHNLKKDEIRLFTLYVDGKRTSPHEFTAVCTELEIPHCPTYMFTKLDHTLPEILKISEMKDILNPDAEAEGLVWRCVQDNLSFKVINNRYLLKKNE